MFIAIGALFPQSAAVLETTAAAVRPLLTPNPVELVREDGLDLVAVMQ
jgi:hypothetical protein